MPLTVLNDDWVWGGAAQIGATYPFAIHWFLDANYTYSRSANLTIGTSVFVHDQMGPVSNSGPAVVNTQERITNQSVMLTLDYQFH